jgi:hypothetical protein
MTTAAVRLDDLASPVFASDVAELMAAGAALAPLLELTEEAILGQATAELGLDDFGPDTFREPLAVLLAALRDEANLSAMGKVSVHTQLVALAKNRLLLADLLRHHPEIHDVEIVAPIVIVGQPRTGTTHLHNLLSADPALRSLPYWESQQPVPLPAEVGVTPDPRLARCQFGVDFLESAMPYFKRMHEMTVDHVHEEIQLLAMEFSTMLFESMVLVPSYAEWYRAHDQTPHYRYLKTVLQAMTFLRGGRRWVLKSPQHLEQLGPLTTVFPDAIVLVTHRDPVSVTVSVCTMLTYTARLQVDHPDPLAMGAYWSARNRQMLEACLRDRDLVAPERSLDVVFHEFMADDMAIVERIYELADQPHDAAARSAQRAYLRSHQRDRHGKVIYETEPFGIDARALRAAFAPYCERFGVAEEWPV